MLNLSFFNCLAASSLAISMAEASDLPEREMIELDGFWIHTTETSIAQFPADADADKITTAAALGGMDLNRCEPTM